MCLYICQILNTVKFLLKFFYLTKLQHHISIYLNQQFVASFCNNANQKIQQLMQTLEKDRLIRLRNMTTILGEPDLLTILKITTVNSFLSHKKTYDKEEKFIFGLNFPTTAHFSSFVNDKILGQHKNNKSESSYKIKLYIYDAYRKIDLQIQINIPGSLEIKSFNLSGQPVNASSSDYEIAYYSSVLRSLYPHFYHQNTEVFGQVQTYQVLQFFIKNFIPFAVKNQLPPIIQDLYDIQNVGIQLLINYFKQNEFWNLSNILLAQLTKCFPRRALFLSLQLKQLKEQFRQIVLQCAENLAKQNIPPQILRKISQFQVRSLCKLKKKSQAKHLGQCLIRQGLDDLQTWQEVLKLHFEGQDDRNYFKMLNTAVSMAAEDSLLRQRLQKAVIPKKILPQKQYEQKIDEKSKKGDSIFNHPEYAFRFDYRYMENQSKLKNLHQLLDKTQKQKSTSDIIHRLDLSYQKQSFFQKFVALYEKQRGWNKLLHQRAECFWLENDYAAYEISIKKKNTEMSYRFNNESIYDLEESTKKSTQNKSKMEQQVLRIQPQQKHQKHDDYLNSSFEGEFSDADSESQKQIDMVAPCSKRVVTKRVIHQRVKKVQFSKVLCNYALEKIFLIAYNNLKLHTDIEKWTAKLNFENLNHFSRQKKQLIGYVFLKKGFFHKTMLRYRKSEQSFKVARKCSTSPMIGLIACYCLAKLYLQHNNIKGVEYYTVQIVRILYTLRIQAYQYVPIWAKQIIPYIIKFYSKAIIKRLQGPLKQLVHLWLKIDNKGI